MTRKFVLVTFALTALAVMPRLGLASGGVSAVEISNTLNGSTITTNRTALYDVAVGTSDVPAYVLCFDSAPIGALTINSPNPVWRAYSSSYSVTANAITSPSSRPPAEPIEISNGLYCQGSTAVMKSIILHKQ